MLDGLGLADAYLRRAYVESACVLEPGEPVLLEHDGAVFALIRRVDPVDAITPYGYGGPVGRDVRAFWAAYAGQEPPGGPRGPARSRGWSP